MSPQRTVLAPFEDVLQGRGEVLTVAGEMVRGQGLPDGLPDEVYEWARVRAFRLANAIDRQVRVEHYELKSDRAPVEEHPNTQGAARMTVDCKPNLGCATTRELLVELKARGEVSHSIGEYPDEMGALAIGAANILDSLPGSMLDYRTVGEAQPTTDKVDP